MHLDRLLEHIDGRLIDLIGVLKLQEVLLLLLLFDLEMLQLLLLVFVLFPPKLSFANGRINDLAKFVLNVSHPAGGIDHATRSDEIIFPDSVQQLLLADLGLDQLLMQLVGRGL